MAPFMTPVSDMAALVFAKRNPQTPTTRTSPPTRASLSAEGGFIEAWAQGFNVGSLIILILIVFCNYRSGIWLHKLILLELVLAIWHGTFIFVDDPIYGWYLSVTATLLFASYFLHNVVSWIKIQPFLPLWGSRFFIISLICVQPFWVIEAWTNFAYFNSLGSNANLRTRPWEALLRDPWWIFTTWKLINCITKTYGFKLWALMRINTRFAILLLCMALSIAFILTDVVVSAAKLTANSGINPYWRFALVFKCGSDTIFLDDFKSVLDGIVARKFSTAGKGVHHPSMGHAPNQDNDGRKQSHHISRGDEFIECTSLEDPVLRPVHTNTSSSQSTVSRPRHFIRFSKERKSSLSDIHVQHETIITSEPRTSTSVRWLSDARPVPRPAHPIYATENARARDSDASLFNGKLV